MSSKAKLLIDEKEINVLLFHYGFNQVADATGRPSQKPVFVGLQLVIETQKDVNLVYWSIAPNQTKQLELHIHPIVLGGKIRKLYFSDCHLVKWENDFTAIGKQPLSETLHITSAGVKDSNSATEYSAYWRETYEEDNVAPTTIEQTTPSINNLNWIDPETKETLKETTYTESIALTSQIENQEGSSATITITKEDGTEFENGQTELTFEEAINDDGTVELTALDIKEQWEEFKTADIDKLVAKIEHAGVSKKSKLLQIVPQPKVIVDFRPNSSWKGEFGFDWIRSGDTELDGDVDYKTIIGKYGKDYATQPNAVFTKDEKKYDDLVSNDFETIVIANKKNNKGEIEKYSIPYLSIYKDSDPKKKNYKANLELLTEIIDKEPDKVLLKHHKKYFKISTKSNIITTEGDYNFVELKNKAVTSKTEKSGNVKTGKLHKEEVIIECLSEFKKDEYIEVYSIFTVNKKEVKKIAGKLNIIANNKDNRRIANIVFVNVLANINGEKKGSEPVGISVSDQTKQKKYLEPFLRQGLIKPNIINKDLSLSDNKILNKDYILKYNSVNMFSKYNVTKSSGDDLVTFLEKQFSKNPKNKVYQDYYKVFFLGNGGGRKNAAGKIVHLGGHANGIPSKECIMYKNPQPFFVSHELMHCMKLYHSFDNNGEFTFKIGQTENIMDYSHMSKYSGGKTITQISTWKWQWDILKAQTNKEP